MYNKDLVSFDVTSLFTNVPIDHALTLLETFLNQNPQTFDLPFHTIKAMILLIMKHASFQFNEKIFITKGTD